MKKLFTLLTALMFGFATLTSSASTFQQKPATTQHLKKDGTPDKRFKENKTPKGPLKKDGTPDMRYKANKTVKKKK
jgi:hypothetical protein